MNWVTISEVPCRNLSMHLADARNIAQVQKGLMQKENQYKSSPTSRWKAFAAIRIAERTTLRRLESFFEVSTPSKMGKERPEASRQQH